MLKAINCDLVGHVEFDPASAFSRHITDQQYINMNRLVA